jgi:hypothetical protein
MLKRQNKKQTIIYKTLLRKLIIEQQNRGEQGCSGEWAVSVLMVQFALLLNQVSISLMQIYTVMYNFLPLLHPKDTGREKYMTMM